MQVRLLYFVICESSSVDRRSNKISIFNIIEGLRVEKKELTDNTKQGIWSDFECIACWYRESNEPVFGCEQKIVLIDPDEHEIQQFPLQNFDLTGKRHTQILIVSGLQIPHPPHPKQGTYEFRLFLRTGDSDKETLVAEYPFSFEFKNESS